jgi:protein-disulfide isomerase
MSLARPSRRLLTALFLATSLTGSAAMATDLAQMTEAERVAFNAQVRAYLLENPEVLMEAMQVLQDRQDQAAADRDQQVLSDNADFLFNDPGSWVGGNPDGDITVVEFMDYRCSYCRKAYAEIEDLVKSDGNVRFVLKEFPILGEDSVASSRFAVAVRMLHGDDAYKAAHDALITLRGSPDAETLGRLAGDLGLEAQPILERMGSEEVTKIIADNHAIAEALAITGTPTFIMGKSLLRGYVPEDQMRQLLEQERAG